MSERQPTIEQKSHFTAKTKQGQDIEFEATLRFFVSPTGDVTITAPGAVSVGQPSRATSAGTPSGEASPGSQPSGPPPSPPPARGRSASPGKSRESERMTERIEIPRESIDRAYPRGPPNDCPITQFIPDPCRAIDDLQKSVKSLFSSFFSGPECPPPQNIGNPMPRGPFNSPEVSEIIENSKENKTGSEAINNEEKYDV